MGKFTAKQIAINLCLSTVVRVDNHLLPLIHLALETVEPFPACRGETVVDDTNHLPGGIRYNAGILFAPDAKTAVAVQYGWACLQLCASHLSHNIRTHQGAVGKQVG